MAEDTSMTIGGFKVGILGTGLYGRAIADRIRRCSEIEVMVGSRNPSTQTKTVSHDEAVEGADVIILAVPATIYPKIPINIWELIKKDAVVIDIANRPLSKKFDNDSSSTVEIVAKLVPEHAHAAKAFNTISSYNIAPNHSTKAVPPVHFAADSPIAIEKVSRLIRSMRMLPIHFGGLNTAIDLEKSSHRVFPTWRCPIIVSTIIWAWWILYTTLSLYVIPGRNGYPPEEWETYPNFTFMASTGETAMTLFAITFLAGPLAILIQVARKSASKPFGKFMGTWLGMRKELGVSAFVFSIAHALSGVLADAVPNDPVISGSRGQIYAVFGIISFVMFGILAVSSNKSVADDMSWAEFQIIFSWVGIGGLIFGVLHQGFWAAEFLKEYSNPRFWPGNGIIMPRYWLGIILPILTLVIRFITWSPCLLPSIRKLRGEIGELNPTENE